MSKNGRIHAELSDDNFNFFESEKKRTGIVQTTAMLNSLLSELRHLRTESPKPAHYRTRTSPSQ